MLTLLTPHLRLISAKARRTDGHRQFAAAAARVQRPLHGVHNDFGPTFKAELLRGLRQQETTAAVGAEAAAAAAVEEADEPLQAVTVGLCKQLRAAGIGAAELQSSRVLVVNTWRSLHAEAVRRQPLVLVDRRSVATEDLAVIPMPAGLSSEFAVPPPLQT